MARKSKIIFISLGAAAVLSVIVAIVASPSGKPEEQEKMVPSTTGAAPDAPPRDLSPEQKAKITKEK